MKAKKTSRVASIDALRAITMILMLFVNDIPALKGVPHWLFHAAADEDMLGFLLVDCHPDSEVDETSRAGGQIINRLKKPSALIP